MPDRVQGNGQKDTHQTWKKSGWTEKELVRGKEYNKIKNVLEEISRLEDKEQISDVEDRVIENTQAEQRKKIKNENGLGDLCDISSVWTFAL